MYAPYYEAKSNVKTDPTYDSFIYQSESTVEMTEDIFNELLVKEIFNPEVFDYDLNGVIYSAYSQAIPTNAQSVEEIEFYLLLLV